MANVTAKLTINENGADEITSASTSATINNLSKPFAWGNTTKSNGFNAICIGKYAIGDIGYLADESGINGYAFDVVKDDKTTETDIVLTFIGTNIDSITIYGNAVAKQWITKVVLDSGTVNEKILYSDDNKFSIIFNEVANSHTVTIKEWNRANYNAYITYIEVFPNIINFGKEWISQVDSYSQSSDKSNEIRYGLLANTGSIDIYDIDGEIKDYSENGYLTNNVFSVTIFVNGKELQTHIADGTPYYGKGKLSLELTNDLSLYDDIQYLGKTYTAQTNLYIVLSDIFLDTLTDYVQGDIDKMLDKVINVGNADITVKAYLQSIIVPAFSMKKSSIRLAVNKVCTVAQLNCFMNDDNEIKFINARPKITADERNNIIVLPQKNRREPLEYDIIPTNKYDKVEIV